VRGLARCEHCGKMLGLADVKKTVPAASMGNVTAKIRIARCEKCGKESQFVSER
jgi:phage FluMu protein Com